MIDPISSGLGLLSVGLRPYVAKRASVMCYGTQIVKDIENGDVQYLLLLMWDHWNELFRQDLTFVERSLVSELRDFRNRWAHQGPMNEKDNYRVLDDIERLLSAIHSDQVVKVTELRRESLNRLWHAEMKDSSSRKIRVIWPFLLCLASAIAFSTFFFCYYQTPWNGILSMSIVALLARLAWAQSIKEANLTVGPRECFHCGKIIYSTSCPYCHPSQHTREVAPVVALSQPFFHQKIDPRMTLVQKTDETLLPTNRTNEPLMRRGAK